MKPRLKKSTLTLITLSLIALSVLLTGSAIAQNRDQDRDFRKGPPSAETVLARLSESLDLNNEQSAAMLVVLQEQAAERFALHEQTMQLLGPEICAQQAATEEAMLAILTPDQAEEFLQMKEARKAKAAQRDRGRGRNHPDCSEYETNS